MRAEVGRQVEIFLLSLSATWAVHHAVARACEVDADCGAGYVCNAYDDTICTSQYCEPGEVCPPDCETYHISYCANALCTADSDCPDTMLCHAESVVVCEDSVQESCPDDGTPCESAPSPSANCRSEVAPAVCQPLYELPCANDADCGGGFRCTERSAHWCAGSTPISAADGGVVTSPPPAECGEERTGAFYCALLELPCASDSECPAGLGCFDNPARVICRRVPASSGSLADAGAGAASTGASSSSGPMADGAPPVLPFSPSSNIICEAVPGAPAKLCVPPRWAEGRTVPGVPAGGATDPVDPGEDDVDPANDESVEPPSSSDKPRRGRGLGWLRRALREGRGCAITHAERGEGFELSWLLLGAALAVRSARRRR